MSNFKGYKLIYSLFNSYGYAYSLSKKSKLLKKFYIFDMWLLGNNLLYLYIGSK